MVGGSLSLWKVLMNSRFYRTSHTLLQLICGLRTCTASRSAYFVFCLSPLVRGSSGRDGTSGRRHEANGSERTSLI